MQFGPNEDFAHYPRTPHEDERMLAAAGCNLMFMPDVAEIYPNGSERATRVEVPGLSRILRGEFRPGHFEGVSTVVAKLFHIVEPDVAVFGEKDFQQLAVIRRMVADLCMPVEIVGAPTVRDARRAGHELAQPVPDGRGARASRRASTRRCRRAAKRLRGRRPRFASIERAGCQTLEAAGFRPDYFAVRQATDLGAPAAAREPRGARRGAPRQGAPHRQHQVSAAS